MDLRLHVELLLLYSLKLRQTYCKTTRNFENHDPTAAVRLDDGISGFSCRSHALRRALRAVFCVATPSNDNASRANSPVASRLLSQTTQPIH